MALLVVGALAMPTAAAAATPDDRRADRAETVDFVSYARALVEDAVRSLGAFFDLRNEKRDAADDGESERNGRRNPDHGEAFRDRGYDWDS